MLPDVIPDLAVEHTVFKLLQPFFFQEFTGTWLRLGKRL